MEKSKIIFVINKVVSVRGRTARSEWLNL